MSPTRLPADIWIWIIENHISGQELASLASTDKSLRDLALPSLFKFLTFELDVEGGRREFHAQLARAQVRAESLLDCEHLLYHVRSFQLSQWHPVKREAWHSTYNSITALLLALPRVRSLELHKCHLAPGILFSIFQNQRLTDLKIVSCTQSQRQDDQITIYPPDTMHLTHLTFDHYHAKLNLPTPCLKQVIQASLFSLASLKITAPHIAHFAETLGDHPIPISHLVILAVAEQCHPESALLCKLLTCCTKLRRLEISPDVPFDLGNLPPDALPNLDSLFASAEVLSALVPGRPVDNIFLFNAFSGPTPHEKLDKFRQSAVPITSLSVTMYETFHRQVSHLARSDAFVNVTRLFLVFTSTEVTSRLVLEDEKQSLLKALPTWPQLRDCRMSVASCWVDIDHGLAAQNMQSPVGLKGDPTQRGHPSLESIRLVSRFVWTWLPRAGWTCTESLDYSPLEQEDVW